MEKMFLLVVLFKIIGFLVIFLMSILFLGFVALFIEEILERIKKKNE